MRWTPEAIETLKRLRSERLTFDQCAIQMGTTRGSIASAVRVHIQGLQDSRSERNKRVTNHDRMPTTLHMWSERALTETWPERKARLARERAAT